MLCTQFIYLFIYFQGSVTAMTVFFPLDTARLRLQGKCQTQFSLYSGICVFLPWKFVRVVAGGTVLHEEEPHLCNVFQLLTPCFQLKVILP